jgi:microcystin-dependent protein
MAEPFIAEIRLFAGNFAPQGWALCDGSILPINQNQALFSLLGTTYGGNGTTNFALPDLRGRAPIHVGQGPGLSPYTLGETSGEETVTLNTNQIPAHQHLQPATNAEEGTNRPGNAVPARGGVYAGTSDGSALAPSSPAGGSQPHDNRSPYLVVTFIIALQGIFPSRN